MTVERPILIVTREMREKLCADFGRSRNNLNEIINFYNNSPVARKIRKAAIEMGAQVWKKKELVYDKESDC